MSLTTVVSALAYRSVRGMGGGKCQWYQKLNFGFNLIYRNIMCVALCVSLTFLLYMFRCYYGTRCSRLLVSKIQIRLRYCWCWWDAGCCWWVPQSTISLRCRLILLFYGLYCSLYHFRHFRSFTAPLCNFSTICNY